MSTRMLGQEHQLCTPSLHYREAEAQATPTFPVELYEEWPPEIQHWFAGQQARLSNEESPSTLISKEIMLFPLIGYGNLVRDYFFQDLCCTDPLDIPRVSLLDCQ